ncbi:hypothetical protein CROQUDRAFT_86291 [Cronartium quercuum f. sp. fusiforme G11]|uniref:Uncharacterized protein n=1 Tax=Cronartium quercuum f. sp. fusiforme G11 TaxID=708437 RepID=A0A9P6NQT6_9BASI|nr:hypothetical protein CROQUDRAFT_86291 [Cronartium quercuum f. sp. fusiforme G11]
MHQAQAKRIMFWDLVNNIALNSSLYHSLTVETLVHLVLLAADFINHTGDVFAPSRTQAPIKFLTQCMPECHPVDLSQLWFWTY